LAWPGLVRSPGIQSAEIWYLKVGRSGGKEKSTDPFEQDQGSAQSDGARVGGAPSHDRRKDVDKPRDKNLRDQEITITPFAWPPENQRENAQEHRTANKRKGRNLKPNTEVR